MGNVILLIPEAGSVSEQQLKVRFALEMKGLAAVIPSVRTKVFLDE